jgi:nucleotide-binding universal stress UspA family protein
MEVRAAFHSYGKSCFTSIWIAANPVMLCSFLHRPRGLDSSPPLPLLDQFQAVAGRIHSNANHHAGIPEWERLSVHRTACRFNCRDGDPMRKIWQQRLDACVRHFKAKGGGLLHDGLAAPAILSAASEMPAQLIVVGTHGRTGLSRIVALGSVAESVVRAAPCSVLIVPLV